MKDSGICKQYKDAAGEYISERSISIKSEHEQTLYSMWCDILQPPLLSSFFFF